VLFVAAAIGLCCAHAGCVQRRLTIRTNPPGALVYIDDYEIGTTPVSTDYIYYGVREFRVVKDGYETVHQLQYVPPPWYQFFPLDFVAENAIPYEIRDQRTFDFQLVPQTVVPTDELLGRAEGLRGRTQPLAPQPAIPPPGESPVQPLPPPQSEPGLPEFRLPR
jgi:hypothetical protein